MTGELGYTGLLDAQAGLLPAMLIWMDTVGVPRGRAQTALETGMWLLPGLMLVIHAAPGKLCPCSGMPSGGSVHSQGHSQLSSSLWPWPHISSLGEV